MEIGSIIRKNRREKDLTQENLAEVLGVSVSAVSLWESGKTMPDLGLIPALCSVLEVSADELLGIDVASKQQEIDRIVEESRKYSDRGYTEEALAILEAGQKKHPDSYHLMHNLLHLYHRLARDGDDAARQRTIELGERIFEKCPIHGIRSHAVQILCILYRDDNPERAKELVADMEGIYTCREVLAVHAYKGDKQIEYAQNLLTTTLDLMTRNLYANYSYDSGEKRYSRDEMTAMRKKVIAIYHTIFENGDFGFYHTRLQDMEMPLAVTYAEEGDREKALAHLQQAAYHAVEFVKFAGAGEYHHTSLAVRGKKEGVFSTTGTANNAAEVREAMADTRYDFLRDTEEFKAILADLDRYAGNWEKRA